MKKKYKALIFIGVLLLIVYLIFPNSFPPRTPLKVARLVSGLKIPGDIRFKMLQDDWAFNGDGTTHVKAKLTDEQLNEILQQATDKNYKVLPVLEKYSEISIPEGIADMENGYYQLDIDKDDPRDYTLTIIDSDKKEMIVYIWFM
ncbi:hypothetical protein [Adhaeribacter soli]|uniref:Uncharacterized protein n=1 Tax=Adhaeribacter soli TaxID=2607655 RepID=A0A5N1IXE7_9BACT|nr:hypothetical protein [Adhaeribacter soli]KAA9332742.1 hypothetical protein F0P94_12105 [Adhaeribacter soli]